MSSAKRIQRSFLLACPALALLSAPAAAQFSGYYVELSGGSTDSVVEPLPPISPDSAGSELEDDSGTWSLTYGLRFNDTISVEIGYSDFGSYSGLATLTDTVVFVEDPNADDLVFLEADALVESQTEYEATAVDVSVIANWPISRRWSVFGELGLAAWDVESDLSGTVTYSGEVNDQDSFTADFSDSGSGFFYGVGLQYRFNLSYGMKLQYQRLKLESEIFTSDADLDTLSVGVRLYF